MPVISRLGNADVYRSIVLGTSVMPARPVENMIEVPLEKRNNSKAFSRHCCLAAKTAGQHVKISRYQLRELPMAVAKHIMSHHHGSVTLVSSSALTYSGLLALEWLASFLPCIAHSCPWGRGAHSPNSKSDARGGTKAAPVPRGQRSKQLSIQGVAPAMDDRMASSSSARPKHGALALDKGSQA